MGKQRQNEEEEEEEVEEAELKGKSGECGGGRDTGTRILDFCRVRLNFYWIVSKKSSVGNRTGQVQQVKYGFFRRKLKYKNRNNSVKVNRFLIAAGGGGQRPGSPLFGEPSAQNAETLAATT